MERFKKILSFILSFVLIMGGVPSPDLVNRVMAEERVVNIASTEDWNNFVYDLENGYLGSDPLIVNLTADITITEMVDSVFKGTFNGGGHTLTVSLNDSELGNPAYSSDESHDGVAPFRFTAGAVIRFLKVNGTITTSSHKYAAGIIGQTNMYGTDEIYNCNSSVVIKSGVNGNGGHGGLVGKGSGNLNISNCLFNGKLLTYGEGVTTTKCGGLIGYYQGDQASIKNCLYDPVTIEDGEREVQSGDDFFSISRTIIGDDDDYTLEKVYYTRSLGELQGADCSSMSTGELAKELGDGWELSGSEVIPIIDGNSFLVASIGNVEDWYYSEGEIVHPEPVVKDADGNVLVKGTDYEVIYSSEDDSSGGNYTLTVKAKEGSGYSGSKTVSYDVYAVSGKSITGLGTGTIADPVDPDEIDFHKGWSGNYVYYGKYDGNNPTKYRVLDKAATEYGGNTLLLDCDSVLFNEAFDGRNEFKWSDSNVNNILNGDKFLNKAGIFTSAEREAIAYSTKATESKDDGEGIENTSISDKFTPVGDGSFVPLNSDRVFLLDAREATRSSYGYPLSEGSYKKIKYGKDGNWWLRTAGSYVEKSGCFSRILVITSQASAVHEKGVSPAFNVNLPSVIFSSTIPETKGEYKLTLSDKNIGIAVPEGSNAIRTDNIVAVPYVVSGENKGNVNRISVLLLKDEYKPGKCVTNSDGDDIPDITYLQLNTALKKDGSEGSGTFTLPDKYYNKTWGLDYHVYLLAEDVNDRYETDYASSPLEIKHVLEHDFEYSSSGADIIASCKKTKCSLKDKKAVLTINAPQKKTYGDTGSAEASLTGLSLFNAATLLFVDESSIRYVGRNGTSYAESETAPTDAGKYTAKITVKGVTASVDYEILKADNSTAATVSANNRTADGTEKPLVTVDNKTLSGGTMYYALGSDAVTAPAAGQFTTTVPTAKDAGTYYVWYKVVGDKNHNDSEASLVTVIISENEPEKPKPKEIVVSLNSIPVGNGKIEMKLVTEESSKEEYAVSDVVIPEEVALALFGNLSDEEKKLVENGASFTISLEIKEKTDVSEEDKKKAEDAALGVAAGGETGTGLFLDISLFTQLEGAEKKEAEPGEGNKVSFTVKVPASLTPAEEGTDRTYILVHILDDGTAVIAATSKNTEFPVETDSFSSWYLTYADSKKAEDEPAAEKPAAEKPAEKVITAADNLPMTYSEETKGDFKISYYHEIPFFGKAKPVLAFFGGIKVIAGDKEYKASKIKVNKKKCLIQITGLEGADKDTVKAVKKATKGANGLSFKINQYYVKQTDKVTPKTKKDGSLKSVTVEIKGKNYKAKKGEFSYDPDKKLITFSGNLNGSYLLK